MTDEPEADRQPGGGRAVYVTATGTFLAMTAFSGPLSIVTAIAADLHAGPVATSWILSSMSLGLAVTMLIAGALGDELGHRRVFLGCGTQDGVRAEPRTEVSQQPIVVLEVRQGQLDHTTVSAKRSLSNAGNKSPQ